MAYNIQDNRAGVQPIATVDTVQNHPLGTIIRASDPTYGAGEFIYLKGVTSAAVGHIVSYDVGFAAVLDSVALDKPRPYAMLMSAIDASTKYGWAQIAGQAIVKKADTVSFAAGAGLGSGSGLAVAVATGSIINGALVAVVASAKTGVETVRVMISRPHGPSDVS